jgi:hypothetical protein
MAPRISRWLPCNPRNRSPQRRVRKNHVLTTHHHTTEEETTMTTKRRPQAAKPAKPANNNRPSNYEFLPYAGTETEVVDELHAGAVPSWRLLEIARWHDARSAGRNRLIATRLRAVAGMQDMQVAA